MKSLKRGDIGKEEEYFKKGVSNPFVNCGKLIIKYSPSKLKGCYLSIPETFCRSAVPSVYSLLAEDDLSLQSRINQCPQSIAFVLAKPILSLFLAPHAPRSWLGKVMDQVVENHSLFFSYLI